MGESQARPETVRLADFVHPETVTNRPYEINGVEHRWLPAAGTEIPVFLDRSGFWACHGPRHAHVSRILPQAKSVPADQ